MLSFQLSVIDVILVIAVVILTLLYLTHRTAPPPIESEPTADAEDQERPLETQGY